MSDALELRPGGDPRCYVRRFWPADTPTRGYPLTLCSLMSDRFGSSFTVPLETRSAARERKFGGGQPDPTPRAPPSHGRKARAYWLYISCQYARHTPSPHRHELPSRSFRKDPLRRSAWQCCWPETAGKAGATPTVILSLFVHLQRCSGYLVIVKLPKCQREPGGQPGHPPRGRSERRYCAAHTAVECMTF